MADTDGFALAGGLGVAVGAALLVPSRRVARTASTSARMSMTASPAAMTAMTAARRRRGLRVTGGRGWASVAPAGSRSMAYSENGFLNSIRAEPAVKPRRSRKHDEHRAVRRLAAAHVPGHPRWSSGPGHGQRARCPLPGFVSLCPDCDTERGSAAGGIFECLRTPFSVLAALPVLRPEYAIPARVWQSHSLSGQEFLVCV